MADPQDIANRFGQAVRAAEASAPGNPHLKKVHDIATEIFLYARDEAGIPLDWAPVAYDDPASMDGGTGKDPDQPPPPPKG